MADSLKGKIKRFLYDNGDYGVALFISESEPLTITGRISSLEKDKDYEIVGEYVTHPKYGFQFNVESFSQCLPSDEEDMINFLSGGLFKGIGEVTAKKIVLALKHHNLDELKDPNILMSLPISNKQKQALLDGLALYDDPLTIRRLSLQSAGFNADEIQRILAYGENDLEMILEDNPYAIYFDVEGIGFIKTDRFALSLGIEIDDSRRKEALLCYIFRDICFKEGNTWLTYEEFMPRYIKESGFDDGDLTLDALLKHHYLKEEDNHFYDYKEYRDEEYIAEFLTSFDGNIAQNKDAYLLIDELEEENGLKYDEKQKEAIISFFENSFSIVTGGPGTGKTTIIKAMVELLRKMNPYVGICVAAPTGRASKRINELCDVDSRTIHSLLHWNKETNTFSYNETNPLLLDVLIVDEFSMVYNMLFASLLKASSMVKKICLIGDNNQLPSIRAGNVLHDLLASNRFKKTALVCNFRQKEGNEIIRLSNEVLEGNIDFNNYHKDVFFIENEDHQKVISLIKHNLENGEDMKDIQLLSPMYRGGMGIDVFNKLLQDTFNPKSPLKKELHLGNKILREGDKVLQLKNQQDDDVYNGDIGILREIDEKEKNIIALYGDSYISYPFDNLNNITLAYATSIHKAQGSEYRNIYLPISNQHMGMLDKRLIYTAITRAKSKLYIIGSKQIIEKAIKRERKERQTGLKEKINQKYC